MVVPSGTAARSTARSCVREGSRPAATSTALIAFSAACCAWKHSVSVSTPGQSTPRATARSLSAYASQRAAAASGGIQLPPLAKGRTIDVTGRVAVVEDVRLGGHDKVHRRTIAAKAPIEMPCRLAPMCAVRHHDEEVDVCLLYTSDAADDLLCVDLGGRRIIKKKK